LKNQKCWSNGKFPLDPFFSFEKIKKLNKEMERLKMKDINKMSLTELEREVIEIYKTIISNQDIQDVEIAKQVLARYESVVNELHSKIDEEIKEQSKKITSTSQMLKKQKSLKNALMKNKDNLDLKTAIIKSVKDTNKL